LAVDDADNIVATFLQPGKVPSIRHRDTTFWLAFDRTPIESSERSHAFLVTRGDEMTRKGKCRGWEERNYSGSSAKCIHLLCYPITISQWLFQSMSEFQWEFARNPKSGKITPKFSFGNLSNFPKSMPIWDNLVKGTQEFRAIKRKFPSNFPGFWIFRIRGMSRRFSWN
jgi:hypothetical protein